MFVISPGDYSMASVAEGDGENAGGVWAVNHWRVGDSPSFARVGGTKYARGLSSSGEPDVGVVLNGDAGSAGGERSFTFDRWWQRVGQQRLPVFAVVFGCDQFEFELA